MKKSLIQLHLAVLLWGFTGVLGRLITLDASVLVWYRMMLTAFFMMLILLAGKQDMRVNATGLRKMFFIGFLMGAHWIAFYGAIKWSNASIALVCLSTAGVFTSLLEPLLNRTRFKPREILLGCVALAGMYFIYSFQQFYAKGIAAGILAALLSAVFTIYNKRIANLYAPKTMILYEMTGGFIVISMCLPLLLHYFPATNMVPAQSAAGALFSDFPKSFFQMPNDWTWLVILALCCTVWAQTLALSALQKLSSFTVALSVNMEPIYGILLAFLLFREHKELNPGFFIGIGLIILSVLLQTLMLWRKRRLA